LILFNSSDDISLLLNGSLISSILFVELDIFVSMLLSLA
jgi:hypothetical protein